MIQNITIQTEVGPVDLVPVDPEHFRLEGSAKAIAIVHVAIPAWEETEHLPIAEAGDAVIRLLYMAARANEGQH